MNKTYLSLLLIVIIFMSCEKEVTQDLTPYVLEVGSFPKPNLPSDNKLTIEKVKLGRMLFYEKLMSKDGTVSCASCHKQENSFNDDLRFSEGVDKKLGDRNAMSVINLAWNTNEFFWDGRSHLLRDQSLGPIENPVEMAETLDNVVAKLSKEDKYVEQFTKAFGEDAINSVNMSLAMEQFMLTIVSNKSKFDKVKEGTATFTTSEQRGKDLFSKEYNEFFPNESGADCQHCHGGFNFENDRYMNNGLSSDMEIENDFGRFEATKIPGDKGKFKVTTLRNIELTAPYMHDGRFTTLEEVVNHYNTGIKPSSTLEPEIENTRVTGLGLSNKDVQDLVAFLKTLTDETIADNEAFKEIK